MRRRLTALVYREAAQRYGVGVALAVLPLVYLAREWPPWAIRDALHALPTPTRAMVLATAHAIYGLATAPLVRQLLASERLRWWWTLPRSAGWWRALHLRHLILLDAPWLAAIAYGVVPLAAHGPTAAITSGLAFAAITLAGQIALVCLLDRSPLMRGPMLGGWAAAVALAVWLPAAAALAVAAIGLGLAVERLGRPMPEACAREAVGPDLVGRVGRHPVVALARLGWWSVRRRDGVAIVWGSLAQLGAVALVALAIVHVQASEPGVVRALARGLAVICASVGAAVALLARRRLDGDRPWLDTWGIEPRHERWSLLLLAIGGVSPALVVGTVVLPGLGDAFDPTWPLTLGLTAIWAALDTVGLAYGLEARRRLHDPRLPRQLLRTGAAVLLVSVAATVWILLPWALVIAWRLPARQRRATRARLRFETSRRDDHRS